MSVLSIIFYALIIAECVLSSTCLIISFAAKSPLQVLYMPYLFLIFYNLEMLTGIEAVVAEISGAELFYVFEMNYLISLGFILIIATITAVIVYPATTRISEITARFMLDRMPGMQMEIDADYYVGNITDDEATTRRENIQKLCRFYGAMDRILRCSKWYLGIIYACGIFIFIYELASAGWSIWGKLFEAKALIFMITTFAPFWGMSFASVNICIRVR